MGLRRIAALSIWVGLGCTPLWASGASAETPLERGTYLVQSFCRLRPGGAPMLPPMGFACSSHISDSDLNAIEANLRSLPPK